VFRLSREHYGWAYKMHLLLPLVARKLGNKWDIISPPPPPLPLWPCLTPKARHWRSAARDVFADQEHIDRDVIPVLVDLFCEGNGDEKGGAR